LRQACQKHGFLMLKKQQVISNYWKFAVNYWKFAVAISLKTMAYATLTKNL
jgi:hypothetical protein